MGAYHFHCSGPAGIVLDVLGSRIEGEAEMIAGAMRAAREVLALYPDADPAAWFVTVQDGTGRQARVLGFAELLRPVEDGAELLSAGAADWSVGAPARV